MRHHAYREDLHPLHSPSGGTEGLWEASHEIPLLPQPCRISHNEAPGHRRPLARKRHRLGGRGGKGGERGGCHEPGDSAGRLVQAAGLKGAREGAAAVSTLHGNFIVNEGGATARDVRKLIERVMAEVKRRFGAQLEPEVEMVGRW